MKNGYITIFDGETFNGWRGYGKDRVPSKWTIEDGCIKFNGSGGGEAQDGDGGDLIFAHSLKTSNWKWSGRFLKVVTPVFLFSSGSYIER